MEHGYAEMIEEKANKVINSMAGRVSPADLVRLRDAYEFARDAHSGQKRRTGEPYIIHPIAVADIAANDLMLGVDPVIACFLHDVVEDTPHTIDEIEARFGKEVAFLVNSVTKKDTGHYESSKQVDNFRKILSTVEYDIRAVLVKLADRLHNMRTLSSMLPDKQMKIAGETDYFYAPLANRLGFYTVKTELENLGLKFRCPQEYEEITSLIERDRQGQKERLQVFCDEVKATLLAAGIDAEVAVEYRHPYSVWRKMRKFGDDFNHLKYRHFTDVIFDTPEGISEKDMALKIYSVLTNRFKEKPGGITNYIDSPKENGYQSFHVKLLADFGRWQEVHISSRRMVLDSKLGCVAERRDDNISRWIEKFRKVLRDIANQSGEGGNFIEKVVTSFYNDDIMIFTPKGRPVVLPQKSTILDFAFEVDEELGRKAKYARVNGFLSSIKSPLRRGDVVEIFTDESSFPQRDWLDSVVTYKAKEAINDYLNSLPVPKYHRCERCHPIPDEELVGFKDQQGEIMLHKRDCPVAISLASQYGDSIVSVDYHADATIYPVEVIVKAVDRYHLFIDLVDCITNRLHLTMNSFNTETVDSIVTCRISFGVHSFTELQSVMRDITKIDGVDEVKRVIIS